MSDARAPTEGSSSASDELAVKVDPDRLIYWFKWIVAFLIATTFLAQFLKSWDKLTALARFFDSNIKVNIPTGYKVFMLTASALVVLAIARSAAQSGDRWTRQWHWLALLVGLLAFDETAYVHQSLSASLDDRLNLPGPLHFSWILLYLPVAAFAIAVLWRFVQTLSPATKKGFALGALLFIGGAGGIEIVKGALAEEFGQSSLRFSLAAAFSDSLEEIGLAVFLIAAIRELWSRVTAVRLHRPA